MESSWVGSIIYYHYYYGMNLFLGTQEDRVLVKWTQIFRFLSHESVWMAWSTGLRKGLQEKVLCGTLTSLLPCALCLALHKCSGQVFWLSCPLMHCLLKTQRRGRFNEGLSDFYLKALCGLMRAIVFLTAFWNRCYDYILHMNIFSWFPIIKNTVPVLSFTSRMVTPSSCLSHVLCTKLVFWLIVESCHFGQKM